MTIINLTKDKIPFWQNGGGNLSVDIPDAQLNQPLPPPPPDKDLAAVTFGVKGDSPFSLGAPNNFKLGVEAGMSAALKPIWLKSGDGSHALLAQYGLDHYFDTHPDMLILALLLKANANASATGTFRYSVLTANATLDVGGQAGYTYMRPFPANKNVQDVLDEFFREMSLPASITTPPLQGEVKAFEVGGYLKVGASLSIGYSLTGAPSFDIGQLQLSEKYSLSVIGSLGLTANIAGYFSVEATAAEDEKHQPIPGWVHVVVRKRRHNELAIAADVSIDAGSKPENLPGSGKEFLGAALGINAKNWLNMLDRVGQLTDFESLKGALDGLAKRFIGEWIGQAFDALSATDFPVILQKIQKVVDSYQKLDDSAITLFDRYFDKLGFLTAKLNELAALTSWDKLKGEVNPDLWEIVRQLTDGDPLSWILGQAKLTDKNGQPLNIATLDELKNRVQQVLELIKSDAHEELRRLIKLAKESFPLDGFLNQLETVDSIPKLKALANTKIGAFVERLIGRAIDQISANSELNNAVKRIQRSLAAVSEFENKLYDKFKEALTQSFSLNLHAEYSQTDEHGALIDVMIRLQDGNGNPLSQGLDLMRAAGSGDFQTVLARYQPDVVKIIGGTLSHIVRKQSSFSINIEGWHSRWHYQGFDRVIVDTEQQIIPGANGGLTVYTTLDLTKEKERQRNGERSYTNFLLRFIGEASGALKFDRENQQYLMDAIMGMAAKYRLNFDDPQTEARELQYYLGFAHDFGLDILGATFAQIQHVMPTKDGEPNNYGRVTADYEVRYTENGLRRLFMASFDETAVREIMRKIVLANYLRQPGLVDIGWGYWTRGNNGQSVNLYAEWKKGQATFVNRLSPIIVQPNEIEASTFAQSPGKPVVLHPNPQLQLLSTLFYIEDELVAGLKKLFALIQQGGGQLSPSAFENALGKIGSALKDFDDFDEGVNTLFAVLDQLVQLQTPASQARASTLKLVSYITVDGEDKQVEKDFLAQNVA